MVLINNCLKNVCVLYIFHMTANAKKIVYEPILFISATAQVIFFDHTIHFSVFGDFEI